MIEKKKLAAMAAACALALCLALPMAGCGGMDEETQRACDLIVSASEDFKDPSSVRVLSGGFYEGEDGEELCVVISATNGWGARTSGTYIVDEIGAYDISDYEYTRPNELSVAKSDTGIDYDAINAELEEKWKSLS